MDKKFVNENKFNEEVERFKKLAEYKSPKQSLKNIYEYTFVTKSRVEEDGDELQQPQGDMQQPQNGAPQPQNQGDGMNGQMNQQMPPQGEQMPQNGDMMPQGDMQQQPPMDNMPMDNGMDGDMQQPPMDDLGVPQVDDDVETQEMEPEDEVIDVDDLTQAQEATEYKIDGVDDRLAKIYDVVQKFNDKLEKQEQSILSLKDEFEKRNPTQTEKFNIRSQAGGPFNQAPGEYWDKVSQENPNYEIMRDNDVSPSDEQKAFEIRKGDISGLNMKNISDTLDMKQNLNDYLGF